MKPNGLVILLIFVSTVFGLFQNCSSGKFDGGMIDPSVGDFSLSSKTPSCSYPTANISFAYPNKLTVGGTVSGFPSGAVIEGACNSTTRTCISDMNWSGSVPLYNNCKQLCKDPADPTITVDPGTHHIWYKKSSAQTSDACLAEKVDSVCNFDAANNPGKFSPSIGTTAYSQCQPSGATCTYTQTTGLAATTGTAVGSTISGFSANSAAGVLCSTLAVTATCMAGSTSGYWDYNGNIYANCTQKCIVPGSVPAVSADVGDVFPTFYTRIYGKTAECNDAKVDAVCTLTTGSFEPALKIASTRYASCTVVDPPSISFTSNKNNIISGQSATLTWNVTGASTISLSDGSSVTQLGQSTGSIDVSPTGDTTYTLSASFTAGTFPSASSSKDLTIRVTTPLALDRPCFDPFGGTGNSTLTTAQGFTASSADGPTLLCRSVTLTCDKTTGNWTGGETPISSTCDQYCVSGVGADLVRVLAGKFYPTYYKINHGTTSECSASEVSTITCDAASGTFLNLDAVRFPTCTPIDPPSIDNFISDLTTITNGDSIKLSWEVHGFSKIELQAVDKDGLTTIEDVTNLTLASSPAGSNNGSISKSPGKDTTYTLSATYAVANFTASPTTTALLSIAVNPASTALGSASSCVDTLIGGTTTYSSGSQISVAYKSSTGSGTSSNTCFSKKVSLLCDAGSWYVNSVTSNNLVSSSTKYYSTCVQSCAYNGNTVTSVTGCTVSGSGQNKVYTPATAYCSSNGTLAKPNNFTTTCH